MSRSDSVDLPWSMCAMMEKFRIWLWSIIGVLLKKKSVRVLYARGKSAKLLRQRVQPRR